MNIHFKITVAFIRVFRRTTPRTPLARELSFLKGFGKRKKGGPLLQALDAQTR